MKIITAVVVVAIGLTGRAGLAQDLQTGQAEEGGEYPMARNTAANPCVTAEQYRTIEAQCNANIKALGLDMAARKGSAATSFSWPLRMAAGANDCGFWGIGAYVDQDMATTTIKDFSCGSNTYDGHQGTDIFIFPYPFYKMDHNQVEVIAAAPGTIINKADGNFDKNCASNSLNPNYIAVQHADGSTALYLHMKNGSLTSKGVGATVTTGEFLGVVGSSGSSTGPHLHFEAWSGSTVATRIDPYAGNCNTLNSASWWAVQKPARDPQIVKAGIHKPAPVLPPCPATETPNEDTCFAPGASVVFSTFMRDETAGMTATMSLLDPAGAVVTTWTHNSTTNNNGSYWTYSRTLPSTPGIYTFKAVYNGATCAKTFKVDCSFVPPTGVGQVKGMQTVVVAPNPAHSALNISGEGLEAGDYVVEMRNVIGQVVATEKLSLINGVLQLNLSTAALPAGTYFLTLEGGGARIVRRVLKED